MPSIPGPQVLELPAVAGHTLTARRGLSLLLVGGYSPENGFNQQLLEYQLATGTWVSGAQSGTPPTVSNRCHLELKERKSLRWAPRSLASGPGQVVMS